MDELLDRFGGRVLVADGAMGTLVCGGHSCTAVPPEEILLSDPGLVARAHAEYAAAGADILVTNTYGAGRLKLREFGLEARQGEIVARAVEAARAGRGSRGCIIAGSIGPLGSFLAPFGPVTTGEALSCFGELAGLLLGRGVDCIALETFTDIRELRLAACAVRTLDPAIPLMISMSFDSGCRTVTGTPADVLADVAGAFGPGWAGVNCGASLRDNEEAALSLLESSSLPVSYQPNAGIPRMEDGRAVWPASPAELALSALKVCRAGASIAGSCCGSTPAHTREIASALEDLPALRRRPEATCSISSRTVRVDFPDRFAVIGEKINPTGRLRLASSIRQGSTGMLRKLSVGQAGHGATILDLNIGIGDPGTEARFMPEAVRALDSVTGLPFLIDSPMPDVVESALPEYPARTFVNSIPCIRSRMERGFPPARLHGAGFIALLMDEDGVPETARGRLALLDRILAAALAAGFRRSDILVDPVVLSEAASPGASRITLEVIREIRSGYGLQTVIGLSNVSFGLPFRRAVSRAFLVQAVSEGLSAAIMDPEDADGGALPGAARMLCSEGAGFAAFSALASDSVPEGTMPSGGRSTSEPATLESALVSGDPSEAARAVREALAVSSPAELVSGVLIPAVTRLGIEYEQGRLFLPQLLAGAEAVRACFDAIRETQGGSADRGTILMATVEGDVHDIGKNIVSAILAGHGWRIVDLGRNVPASRILEAAVDIAPEAIGLSALLTPSLPVMEETVLRIRAAIDPCPAIIIGGAVVTPELAQKLGVLYGRDGIQGAEALERSVKRS